MAATILSPHLDDAVLSCWHLLEGPEDATVIDVFTALPPPGAMAWWDRITGATDSRERMRERLAEDRAALALAGRTPVAIDLLDAQYRREALSVDQVRAAIEPHLVRGTTLVAPASMTAHPDHVAVRDAALALARDGWPLSLYADLPHAIRDGWPTWVTAVADPASRVDAAWRAALAGAGLREDELVPRARALDAATRERKLRALEAYSTQRAALDMVAFVPLRDPRALAWEAGWEVPASALGSSADEVGGKALVTEATREPADNAG